jgi:hypothetical protein
MNTGKFDVAPDTYVADNFKKGASPNMGDIDVGTFDKAALARAYSQAVLPILTSHGYEGLMPGGLVAEWQGAQDFYIDFESPNGSSFSLGFGIDDRMNLRVDFATGVSVAHGNEIDLIEDGVWEFPEAVGYDDIEIFLENFKEW